MSPDELRGVDHLDLIRRSIEAYCEKECQWEFDPNNPVVRLHEPSYNSEEIIAALEVLLSGQVTQGTKVAEFEKAFSNQVRKLPSVACNSGSSANLLAISALCALGDLRPGDEVIVSALSWSTTIWPIVQHNLIPVLVDCDSRTFCIDPLEVKKAISPKTRAIMPVHLYGNPCDMAVLAEVCAPQKLLLIEDCCEASGASYKEVPVGVFGDVATFSFYFSHHITTIEGGMVVTRHEDVAEMMRIQRSHGWVRELEVQEMWRKKRPDLDPKFIFAETGYNLRMTELQAAMGIIQLDKLSGFVDIRRENNLFYKEELQDIQFLSFQREINGSSCFGFSILVDGEAPFTTNQLRTHLEANDVETRGIVAGDMRSQPAMLKVKHQVVGGCPNTAGIARHGFAIGNHHLVDEDARQYVVDKIREFVCEL